MNFKISIILVIALLLISVGAQTVVASGSSSYADANVSVTIISLTQELNYGNPVIFDTSEAVVTNKNGKKAMKLENAGSVNVNTNIPWKLFAVTSSRKDLENIEIYIRVGNDGERNWLLLNNEPVLASSVPGDFYFTWDIMVVADDLDLLNNFEIKFDLQTR